eukprot:2930699-Prorocentrum_lima.AAC.1
MKALVRTFPGVFSRMPQLLDQIGDGAYDVQWDVNRSRVQGGLPHERPRLYIVGVLHSASSQ